MKRIQRQLLQWCESGRGFAIASVTRVEGSAPRSPGATLIVAADGTDFAGSVSAGCLENEVIEAAVEVVSTGRMRVLRFGPEGCPPWQDGLSCGGGVEVRVDPWFGQMGRDDMSALALAIPGWLETGQAAVVLSRGEHHYGFALGEDGVGDRAAFANFEIEEARRHLESGRGSGICEFGGAPVFVRTLLPEPRLLLVGAVDTAVQLVALATTAGYACTVVDPRANYLKPERFHVPPAGLIQAWPKDFSAHGLTPRDSAIVLSHDPKIDDPALVALLATQVGYIGALGSQRSHAKRLERLRAQGVTESQLARIEGPAGLRLGTFDATGIALGMLAGVIRAQAAAGVWE